MAIGLRQGDVVSVFAIVQQAEDGRVRLRIEGGSPEAPEIDLDATQALVVRRSVHQDDDVIYNGEAGWRVLMLPEPGVFVIKPVNAKPGDAASYRVASSSEVRHAADPQTTAREVPQAAAQDAPVPSADAAPAEPTDGLAPSGDAAAPAPAATPSVRFPIEEGDAEHGIHEIAQRALDSRMHPRDRDAMRRPDALEQAAGSIMDAGSVEVVDNPIGEPSDELVLTRTDRV